MRAMTEKTSLFLQRLLELLLGDLNQRGQEMPDPQALYHSGRFSGVLNKLDKNSPHVCTEEDEALKWYNEGLRLIQGMKS